ncbi:hypothetical protein [Gordonia hongkongensis]|uniref:hypothetical protein n=1 Tax=Gordonia hongkongensis TaxID=1701090 RepID=UPI003D707C3C
MALNPDITLEQLRDFISDNMLRQAVAQWERTKTDDPENDHVLRWVEGRIDASLQILLTLDREEADKWVDTRHDQQKLHSSDTDEQNQS